MFDHHPSKPEPVDPIRRLTSQISIAATVERVWLTLIDINKMPGLHPQMLSAEWLDDAPRAALGARFSTKNAHPKLGIWQAISRIIEFRPLRAIAWTREGLAIPPAVCRFQIISGPDENTTLLEQNYIFDTRPGATAPVGDALGGSGGELDE